MDCPDPESLALEPASGAVLKHLSACADCRSVWLALQRSEPAAAPRRSWIGRAAAALLLAGLALWQWGGEAPSASSTPVPARAADPTWVAPGIRLEALRGSVIRLPSDRFRLEAGEVRIEDRLGGGLELETPAGSLKGLGPWAGRVSCGGASGPAWIAPAEAAEVPLLVVEVHEGRVEVRLPGQVLTVDAGERLRVPSGGAPAREAFTPSPPKGLRIFKPGILAGGAFPLDLPDRPEYSVEIRARPLSPDARLGLAAPVAGALRLWQPSGDECPTGETRRLVFAVLGKAASGSVEGSRLWSAQDAARDLQPASGVTGLRAWGRVEVLEVVVHAP